jgi:hypothetical protein
VDNALLRHRAWEEILSDLNAMLLACRPSRMRPRRKSESRNRHCLRVSPRLMEPCSYPLTKITPWTKVAVSVSVKCFQIVSVSPFVALRPSLPGGSATHTPGFFSPPPPRRICETLILIIDTRNANGPDGVVTQSVGNGCCRSKKKLSAGRWHIRSSELAGMDVERPAA